MKLLTDCTQMSLDQWQQFMKNTRPFSGRKLRKLIKENIPELYDRLGLDYHNPYESQCLKGDGYYVYVHSAIEYFIAK